MSSSKKQVYDAPQSLGGDTVWTDTRHSYAVFEGDVDALERDLAARIRGEVRFDSGSKALYATDASNYRQVPIGVVIPLDVNDLVTAITVCHAHGAPVTNRGCGTSLAGQCCNHAVIIDASKYCDAIVEINPEAGYARVEPGVRRDQLTDLTEERHHLTFAPDTSTHQYATFGGMIGNNACGIHSQMARRTQDNVEELEVVLYDGTRLRVGPTSEEELEQIVRDGGRKGRIYEQLRDLRDAYADLIRERYPDIPRRVSGYNLTELLPERDFNVARALVGTEGTCATVLEAKVKLVDSPPERSMLVLGYEDIYAAGDRVAAVNETSPLALEGMDHELIAYMREKHILTPYLDLLPEGGGYLIAEYGGHTPEEAAVRARRAREQIERPDGALLVDLEVVEDPNIQQKIWSIRESGLGATAHLTERAETWPGWEDSAVPPEAIGDYMRGLRDLYDKYGYDAALYGHFGQGCVHTRIPFDLRTEEGLETYRAFVDEASDLCLQYGGSFSAEHGDGQARGELLPKMFGEELMDAFRTFKRIWDPDWKMNPGKVVEPRRMTENLRLGTDYHPVEPSTYFGYPEDDGSFAEASLRCVGVGKCRRHAMGEEGVMCPSFIATHEEMHTTRGRARLLFEMLNGDETPAAWDNDDVFEALDLCLACKGCKNDCPVNVDMATYKAEFLSHYYAHHARPRYAYAFGFIHWWARLASTFPRLANFFTQTPGLSAVTKWIGGIAPEREVPLFPPQTFRAWFEQRSNTREEDRGRRIQHPKSQIQNHVVLFPDTFTNFFTPDVAKAAVEVLEADGYRVTLPTRTLCCGRPLYDYGFLDTARGLWHQTIDALREAARHDVPLVCLEPSCTAAFRDELPNLFPHDEDALRLSENVHTLGEFLHEIVEDYTPPRLERRAYLHGHCHHRAIMGTGSEETILEQMGLDLDVIPSTCCGVAGSFGFEHDHYDVSMACGEHELLPTVRTAENDALIITDGFSCREQIAHATDRRALHLAEVLHVARQAEGGTKPDPERSSLDAPRFPTDDPHVNGVLKKIGWLAVGAFAGAAALTALLTR